MQKWFIGLRWWEILVCGIPMILLLVGGAIGGICGAVGTYLNLKVWKGKQSKELKGLMVFGITVASFFAYFLIAGVFLSLLAFI